MMDEITVIVFVLITSVVAIPNPEIIPPSPAAILVNSEQQFTCSITVQDNWRSVEMKDSTSELINIGFFYKSQGTCRFYTLSSKLKNIYEISCGETVGQFHLTIKSVTKKYHNEFVECRARYGTGRSNDTFVSYSTTIKVIIPLANTYISPDISPMDVEKNEIAYFTCNTTSWPLSNITWQKEKNAENAEELTSYQEQVDDTTIKSYLNYTGKDRDQGAEIFCIGQYNYNNIESNKIRLRIIYAPEKKPNIYQTPPGTVKTGDNVTLTCTVLGGYPLPTLYWNCTGIMNNYTIGNNVSYSVAFTVNKTFNNKICACSVLYHPVMSYRHTVIHVLVVFYPPDTIPIIEQKPPKYIFDGNNVTLTCSVSGGNPLARLSWNCNGTTIKNASEANVSYSVTFPVNKTYNTRICTCSASHIVKSYKHHVNHTLIVYYAPDESPRIQMVPDKNLTTGDNVTLTCIVVGGNPLANLSWNCTGYKTDNTTDRLASDSVAFTVNKTYNNMICTCSATHSVESYRRNVHQILVVYFGPGIPDIHFTPNRPWFEGNSTSLSCIFEDGNPHASIRWKRGNNSMQSHDDNPIFQFKKITSQDDKMQMSCTVSNQYSENVSQNVSLNVHYFPRIMLEKNHIPTNESKNISILCKARGNPVPKVVWITKNKTIHFPTAEESTLSLENINRTDSGNYTCKATAISTIYGYLESSEDAEIVVNFAPDVTVTKDLTNITEHANLTLTCNADGIPPNYAYGWKHTFAGNVIRIIRSNSKTLLLKHISYWDIGMYECFVNNGIEDRHGILNQTNSTLVEVHFKPLFVLYDKVTTGKEGRNVSTSVDFISFPDIEKAVTWRNATENSILVNDSNIFMTLERKCVKTKIYDVYVSFDKYGYTSSLHFPTFNENQDGFYNLEVKNIVGANNMTLRIVFSDRPEPPTMFSASVIGSEVVSLTWKGGLNGGHYQTFIITYWEINSVYNKSVNVSERSDQKYKVEISNLIPSTSYIFHIIAKNAEGYSEAVNNTIRLSTKDILGMTNSVIGPVAGAVGGILAAGLLVIGIIVFRRKYLASGQKTDRKNLTFASPKEEDEEGLHDNELYVSADENFKENLTSTGDVYAVVKKSLDTKAKETHTQETVLYAEVEKIKDVAKHGKVTKNVRTKQTGKNISKGKLQKETGRKVDVYDNIAEQNTKHALKNKNKDGLVYADLVFNEDGKRKFIIRGIENKTDYADIDLELKADPLPSDESEDEKDNVADVEEK